MQSLSVVLGRMQACQRVQAAAADKPSSCQQPAGHCCCEVVHNLEVWVVECLGQKQPRSLAGACMCCLLLAEKLHERPIWELVSGLSPRLTSLSVAVELAQQREPGKQLLSALQQETSPLQPESRPSSCCCVQMLTVL